MGLQELLAQLSQRNIRLQLHGEKLRCLAPPGQLNAALSQAIREHKTALIELLAAQAQLGSPANSAEAVMTQLKSSVSGAVGPALAAAPAGTRIPLSYAQERLWFWDQLRGPNAIYNIPIAIPLSRQTLNLAALKQSCVLLLQRHEVLRTVFRQQEGELFQQVLPNDDQAFELTQRTLSRRYTAEERDARDEEVRRLLQAETQRPFDLSQGPVFRVLVISLDEQTHIIFIGLHHIVCDGWSNLVILRELTSHYRALCSGQAAVVDPLALQYGDYAYWQRQQFTAASSHQAHPHLRYWCEQLAGLPPVLELPYDYPRPAVQSHDGQSLAFELDPKLSAQLKQLAVNQGVSLFMLLLAVFYLMLGRYSQRNDLVVGSPLSQRHHPALEEMVGPFINTVALRVQLNEQHSFADFLSQVRDVVLAAFEHQDVPFEQVVNALELPRSLAHEPLVQVNFLLKAAPVGELLQKDSETLDEQFGFNIRQVATYARSDLIVMTKEEGDRIVGWFEYSTELFAEDRIRRMMVHYQNLLRSVATSPTARLLDLAMLNVHELGLLRRWSGRDQSYDLPADVVVQWQRCVAQHPQRIALSGGDTEYTFAELDALTSRLALLWQEEYGLLPGQRVALRLSDGEAQVVSILALLKLAVAYVPLNPNEATVRLQRILEELDPELVVDDDDYQEDRTQALALPASQVSAFTPTLVGSLEVESSTPAAESVAYIIYTSGSTGRPKGVMVTRTNLNHFCAVRHRYLEQHAAADVQCSEVGQVSKTANPSWRWAWNVAYSFDMAWQGLAALMYGNSLVITSPEVRRDHQLLAEWIAQHRINAIDLTPSQMATLLSINAAPDVSLLVLGGEAIDEELWQRLIQWQNTQAQVHILNAYGPTEATVNTSIANIDATQPKPNIGRPLPGWYCYVLDNNGRLAAPGVPGELYIGGVGVAAAYWQRLDLTAERFISDNWSGDYGQRLYRSGDRVCWMDDGRLAYLGRMDHQMKIRGYRVEPLEVEQALKGLSGMQDAAVCCDTQQDSLVAFVCTSHTDSLPIADWRETLSLQLPDHMIPDRWVELQSLPCNHHGKLDRTALIPLLTGPSSSASTAAGVLDPAISDSTAKNAASSAPLTAIEHSLSDIWALLLPGQGFHAASHFFAQGGHSLLLMRLLHEISQTFAVQLSVKALFEHPLLSDQADLIEAALLARGDEPDQAGDDMARNAEDLVPASSDEQEDEAERDRLLI